MIAASKKAGRGASVGKWVAAAVLLLALAGIGVGIWLSGREGGPTKTPDRRQRAKPMADLVALLPRPGEDSSFELVAPARQWPAEKMHEKIDGEDGAYLKHGCLGLGAATLERRGDGGTIDLFLYQMTTPAAAAAVFDEQAPPADAPEPRRRPTPVDVGDKAYVSYGCCYVRSGPFYLKVITSAAVPSATASAVGLARAFVEKLQASY